MQNAPHKGGALAETDRQEGLVLSVPEPTDEVVEPRYCRFAAIWCRCDVDDLVVTMSVCARHYLHELVSADV